MKQTPFALSDHEISPGSTYKCLQASTMTLNLLSMLSLGLVQVSPNKRNPSQLCHASSICGLFPLDGQAAMYVYFVCNT